MIPYFQTAPGGVVHVRLMVGERMPGSRFVGPVALGSSEAEALGNLQLGLETTVAKLDDWMRKIAFLRRDLSSGLDLVRTIRSRSVDGLSIIK